MMRKIFIKSAGSLLALTALAKLVTAVDGAPIISQHDPILGIQFRYEFWIVGLLELIIASYCVFLQPCRLQYGLVAWLAASFTVYRIGFWSIGMYVCPCLGSFSEAIHLSNVTVNAILLIILAYLLIGSIIGLIVPWPQNPSR